jgi:tyrosyl-tRNA synthetase
MGILPGTDGEVRMSKSLGNHIPILAPPDEMYGKVMSLPDQAMGIYSRLVTRWPVEQIEELEQGLESGTLHPRDAKMKLAREIVEIFHSPTDALQAEENFVRVFRQGDLPVEIPEYHMRAGQTVLDVLEASGLAPSRSEGRRLIGQKGVRLEGEVLSDPNQPFPRPGVLQAGKRRFVRVLDG